MDRHDFPSDATYYRHHRQCLELAMERGCTPAEAEQEILRIARREKERALDDRAKRRADARQQTHAAQLSLGDLPDERWMMRD